MKKIILLILLTILNYACSSHKADLSSDTYYYKCMEDYSRQTGKGFYSELERFKNDLLAYGLIKDKSKDSYANALEQIRLNNQKWKSFYKENKDKSYFYGSIISNLDHLLLVCSDVKIRFKGFDSIKPNLLTIQKFNLYKLSNSPVDDPDILLNLFLASDMHNKTDDLNLILLIFLNMDAHFNPNNPFRYTQNE